MPWFFSYPVEDSLTRWSYQGIFLVNIYFQATILADSGAVHDSHARQDGIIFEAKKEGGGLGRKPS